MACGLITWGSAHFINPSNFKQFFFSDFVCGVSSPPPPIDDLACRKLLRRSTCAILAHLSFDSKGLGCLEMRIFW